jgi:5'-nucleotidase / UDP-sugar diphosphatase
VDPDAVVEEVFVEEVIEEETQKDTSHTNVVEPAPVNDVPESHWAHSEVGKVRSAGFMVAKKPGEFRLADSMSRAEAATVIAKALGSGELTPSPTDTPSAFSDIAQDAWYAPYVAFVLERDIVELRDTFEPVRQINRAELYVMIMKARGIEIDETGATDHFSDIPGGTWFDTVAAAAFKAGLAQGKPRGSAFYFAGGENVTRAEAAVMLSKAFLDNM